MNLVWHIIRKDFRRMAGPLALWLVLLLGHVSLLFVWEGQMGSNPAALEGKRYFVNTCGTIVLGVGFILAAWLVMEDSLVSTTAFWRTRAISGARLLVAKTLGALLMFSVLPALVLTPVWLGCGFSARELGHAAWAFMAAQALCSLAAFALGTVTETSGQFLVRLLGAAILLPLYLAYVLGSFHGYKDQFSDAVTETRTLIVIGLLGLTPAVMIVHQFVTRRLARTCLAFAGGLTLMAIGGCWWPWSFRAWTPPPASLDQNGAAALVFTADGFNANPLQSFGRKIPLQQVGRVTGLAPDQHVRVDRVQAWWLGGKSSRPGPRLTGLVANSQPMGAAVRATAGLPADPAGPVTWSVAGSENNELLALARDNGWQLSGIVKATLLRGKVLGEIPLRDGATLQVGSSSLRIKSVRWIEDKLTVLIEEHDAWITADAGTYSSSYDPARHRVRPAADGFIVLNRGRKLELTPVVEEIGTMTANSILVGRRQLILTPPEGSEDWLDGAVLVKVRFAPEKKITQPLAGELAAPSL